MSDLRGLSAALIVLVLLGGLAWLARRGVFRRFQARGRAIVVESAVSLGDRRSLVVVAVEGRRLLLGLSPANVALVTELQAQPPFEGQSDAHA